MLSAVELYVFAFLHQTTTIVLKWQKLLQLYVFAFLHQTTTMSSVVPKMG